MHMHYRSNSTGLGPAKHAIFCHSDACAYLHIRITFAEHEKQKEKFINYNSIVHQADIVNKENVD